jgi:hypothetical protein
MNHPDPDHACPGCGSKGTPIGAECEECAAFAMELDERHRALLAAIRGTGGGGFDDFDEQLRTASPRRRGRSPFTGSTNGEHFALGCASLIAAVFISLAAFIATVTAVAGIGWLIAKLIA